MKTESGNIEKSLPDGVCFKLSWRSYQQRILHELGMHLSDDHLHVVAAPGSGKTVLGLEVIRRLNRPTLIFAPTRAIRDQWIDRFISLFCPSQFDAGRWISKDIRKPAFITVSTYQGLHSLYMGKSREDQSEEEVEGKNKSRLKIGKKAPKAIEQLVSSGFGVVVLDEAHHLRSEWWRCLIDLKSRLKSPRIVALTATPPYDVSTLEWHRYNEMCGAVDAEICVPELVWHENLCPHEDYVYFSLPVKSEQSQIGQFRKEVGAFLKSLESNMQFTLMLASHRAIGAPEEHIDQVLDDPEFFSSAAIYLHRVGGVKVKKLFKVLGISVKLCPGLTVAMEEAILTGCLYTHADEFAEERDFLDSIARHLKRSGAIDKRKIHLQSNKNLTKMLVSSISKLQSIEDIVRVENDSLGNSLRMVILTDYIHREDLPRGAEDVNELKRIGVVPIFEKIRRAGIKGIRLGILSGSMVVIPVCVKEDFKKLAVKNEVDCSKIKFSSLGCDCEYCHVSIVGLDEQKLVKIVTMLFNGGGITVLVGTKSLLGEGWDAPSINSLVLASFVGSFMLSNQMRGRAIRVERGNSEKASNIWHLVCVETEAVGTGHDFATLKRRLKSFVGVSRLEPTIENGHERLGIFMEQFSREDVDSFNEKTVVAAVDREKLRLRWAQALVNSEDMSMKDFVQADSSGTPRSFVFANAIISILWQFFAWGLMCICLMILSSETVKSGVSGKVFLEFFIKSISFLLLIAAIVTMPFCLKALYLFVRHGPVAGSIKQIGKAVVHSLACANLLETDIGKLRVEARKNKRGQVLCRLKNGSTYENKMFVDSMEQVLGEIDNPRYLIVRKSSFLGIGRKDYHAVPDLLGGRKETANRFMKLWKKYVGPSELIYTRSVEGRKLLLKARNAAMSTAFVRRCERKKLWQ